MTAPVRKSIRAWYGTRAVAADPQRVADRGREDDDRGPGEPEGVAVEADRVRDAEALHPFARRVELEPALVEVVLGRRDDPEADLHQRDEEGEPRGRLARERRIATTSAPAIGSRMSAVVNIG
jgi:hypothetical protein